MSTTHQSAASPKEASKPLSIGQLDLAQIFYACHVYIATIRDSMQSERELSHIDLADETLRWVSAQLSSNSVISHTTTLLLLHVLQNFYELLRDYSDTTQMTLYTLTSAREAILKGIITHGQVHATVEQIADQLTVAPTEDQRVDDYVHSVQRDIDQATEQATPLDKVLIASEIWTDQLAALALLVCPRSVNELKDSVRIALEGIRRVLEPKENGFHP